MASIRKVVCPKCKAELKLDREKITSADSKFRCPSCASILRPRKPGLPKEMLFAFQASSSQPDSKAGVNRNKPDTDTLELAKRLDTEIGLGDVHAEKPEIAGSETDKEITAVHPLPPEEEDGPLIPADKLVDSTPSGETLLEEFTLKQLREFEEGEPEPGDVEWTRFSDNRGKQFAASKIDINELPPSFSFLKETLLKLRQAEELNFKGENRISKNLYEQAIPDLTRALELNPNYIDALINRGSALARLGRFNDALKDFNHALQFEKYDPGIYNRRGEIFLQNNMYDQAIKDFTSALILDPTYGFAYLNRGKAYSGKGMHEEAMADFKEAIRSDSEDSSACLFGQAIPRAYNDNEETPDKQKAAEFIAKGRSDLKNEKYEDAAANFTRAINLSSEDAEIFAYRGNAYVKLLQPDKAMADLKQAVELDPLNPILYFWRAQAWKAKNDLSNMAEDLKLSCELGYEPACQAYSKLTPLKK